MNTLDTIMFHYTTSGNYREMREGSSGTIFDGKGGVFDGRDVRGLWPALAVCNFSVAGLDEQAYMPAAFGLPDSQGWKNNPEFAESWRLLMRRIYKDGEQIVLLQVTLTESDEPHVIERAHIERLRMEVLARNFSKKKEVGAYWRKNEEAYRNYWQSRVPLREYDGRYSLPEVVIWKAVPLERISLVKEMSLTEAIGS